MTSKVDRDSPRCVLISTDGHCGADLLAYKPYLDRGYREEFDAWAETFEDAWAGFDTDHDPNDRKGLASYAAPLNWESANRLKRAESQHIAAEVLFPNTAPPFFPSGALSAPGPLTTGEYHRRFAGVQAHNRWLADFCADAPGRRAGIAQIFLDDVDAAIAEIHWARSAGLMGVLLPSDHVLKLANLYHPRYERFWAACVDLDFPVHRHTISPCGSSAEAGPGAAWVGVVEIEFYGMRAIAHLICAGVFARYPALKFVSTELVTGAAIPAYVGRLDHMYLSVRAGRTTDARLDDAVAQLPRLPSSYFESNCYVAGPLDLPDAITAEVPNVMFGADLPHSEGTTPFTMEALRWSLGGRSNEQIVDVTSRTAAHLYGFDLDLLQSTADRVGPSLDDICSPIAADELPAYPSQTRCRMFAPVAAS